MTECEVGLRERDIDAFGHVDYAAVRSPSLSPGDWERREADAETFVDRRCRTGDLASIDADGFITVRGRAKDMLRSGGENVYPVEVEAVLTTTRGVVDAAIVGLPDPRLHEVGCAFLVAVDGEEIDVKQVRGFYQERMATYEVPEYLVAADAPPRAPSGKVKKLSCAPSMATWRRVEG